MELVFLIAGHSHNIIDQRHSVIQKKWQNTQLYCLEDWNKMINSIPQFHSEELQCYNFDAWLEGSISAGVRTIGLNAAHVFQFTRDGLSTKQYVTDESFGTWRGRGSDITEPFKVLTAMPSGFPDPMTPKHISKRLFFHIKY